MDELAKLTIARARDLLRAGDLTAENLARSCIDAIESAAPLNAFCAATPDLAIDMAREARPAHRDGKRAETLRDTRWRQGPVLHPRRFDAGGVRHSRRVRPRIREFHHRPALEGRSRHGRQDQHGRVRHGLVQSEFGLRAGRQPVAPAVDRPRRWCPAGPREGLRPPLRRTCAWPQPARIRAGQSGSRRRFPV